MVLSGVVDMKHLGAFFIWLAVATNFAFASGGYHCTSNDAKVKLELSGRMPRSAIARTDIQGSIQVELKTIPAQLRSMEIKGGLAAFWFGEDNAFTLVGFQVADGSDPGSSVGFFIRADVKRIHHASLSKLHRVGIGTLEWLVEWQDNNALRARSERLNIELVCTLS